MEKFDYLPKPLPTREDIEGPYLQEISDEVSDEVLSFIRTDPRVIGCEFARNLPKEALDELLDNVSKILSRILQQPIKTYKKKKVIDDNHIEVEYTNAVHSELEAGLKAYRHSLEHVTGALQPAAFSRAQQALFDAPNTIDDEDNGFGTIIFTLNTLKVVNDDIGYDAGDMYLRTYVDAIKYFVCKECPNCKVLIGKLTADNISVAITGRNISEAELTEIGNMVAQNLDNADKKLEIPYGISFGVGACGSKEETADMLERATKELNRKRAIFYESEDRRFDGRNKTREKIDVSRIDLSKVEPYDVKKHERKQIEKTPSEEFIEKVETDIGIYLKSINAGPNKVSNELFNRLLHRAMFIQEEILGPPEEKTDEWLIPRTAVRRALDVHYASFDSLTGVTEATAFKKRLPEMYKKIGDGNKKHGIMITDLAGIGWINHEYGHDAGDVYIVLFTKLLRRALEDSFGKNRGPDFDFEIARLGGDEFQVMVPFAEKDGDEEAFKLFSERFKELLEQKATLEELRQDLEGTGLKIAKPYPLGCGLGTSIWEPGKSGSVKATEKKAGDNSHKNKIDYYADHKDRDRRLVWNS